MSVIQNRSAGLRRHLGRRLASVSLRARLLALLLALLVAAVAGTGWGVHQVLKGYLVSQADAELARSGLPVARRAYAQVAELPDPFVRQNSLLPSSYVALITFEGYGSQLIDDRDAARTAPAPPRLPSLPQEQAAARAGRPFDAHSADGVRWRAVAYPIDGRFPGSAIVALPLTPVQEALARLRLIILLIGGALTLACAVLGRHAIRHAFAPLVEVERTAAAIAAGDLSRRVPERPPSTEVGRLTASLNGMLAQIESAFRAREASEARTRRFAADASHELRTPLATIRGFAELYRQGAVPPDEVPRTLRRIEDEAARMGALVEDLLLLARLDEQRPGRQDPVDLAVLAGDAVHDARGLAADRTVTLGGLAPGSGPAPAVVTGDEHRLRQVVANLVSNALRHTPTGTPVEVAVGRHAGWAVLEVRDHGPGLLPDQVGRVFERFYRVDASRRRDGGGGAGLGLSIVSAVVSAHHGRVEVSGTPGGGATFRMMLPERPGTSGPEDLIPVPSELPAGTQAASTSMPLTGPNSTHGGELP